MNDREREASDGGKQRLEFEQAALLMTTWDDGEAAMVRQILESQGIPTQVVSDVPHSVYPLSVDGLGEVRILVPPERLDEARAVLAEHRRDGREAADGEDGEAPGDDGAERP